MSEYQYYEFRAIDRPLDKKQIEALEGLSSRAEITPTSFTNTYNYGDFRGDPHALMERYFDAFVYVANWGTHRLMFRVPRNFLDVGAASEYCDDEDEYLSLKVKKDHVVLEFLSQDENEAGWTQGEPWMPELIELRAELINGDFRPLYLAWLASIQWLIRDENEDEDDDGDEFYEKAAKAKRERVEPPVPPGLTKLTAPQKALAEFLRIDESLIGAAAAGSVGDVPAAPSRADMAQWIQKLPSKEKDDFLLRLLDEEGERLIRAELSRRFLEATRPAGRSAVSSAKRRTVAQLIDARKALSEKKQRQAEQRALKERERREAERAKYLDNLAGHEPETWRLVEELIATKKQDDYDRAVTLLVDLRDLAARTGQTAPFESQIRDLRDRHKSKSSLLRRLDSKQLRKSR
jgi:hypothetical protein